MRTVSFSAVSARGMTLARARSSSAALTVAARASSSAFLRVCSSAWALRVRSSSAALAVINARMAKALVEQERVKRELELAAEIQRPQPRQRTVQGLPPAPMDGATAQQLAQGQHAAIASAHEHDLDA